MAKPIGELEAEFFRRRFAAIKRPQMTQAATPVIDTNFSSGGLGVDDLPSIKKAVAPPPKQTPEQIQDDATQKEIDRRFGEGDLWGGSTLAAGNAVGKAANAPVVKQLLDMISVFNYAGANVVDENLKDIQEGDWNPVSGISNLFEGVGRGLSGAAGNVNDKTTYADVIKRGQEMAGIDPNSEESKLVAGIGGFVGDVALDPTTYIGIGLARGAIKGASNAAKFGRESKIAKEAGLDAKEVAPRPGNLTPEYKQFVKENKNAKIRPTERFKEQERLDNLFDGVKRAPAENRIQAFSAGFKGGVDDFRSGVVSKRDARQERRLFKNTSDEQKEWLIENIPGLRPAVARRAAEEIALKAAAEAGIKLTNKQKEAATADIIMQVAESRAQRGVQQVIPGTKTQKLVGKGEELDQALFDSNKRRSDEYINTNGSDNLNVNKGAPSPDIDNMASPSNLGTDRSANMVPDIADAVDIAPVPKGRQEALFPVGDLKTGKEAPGIMRNAGNNQSDIVSELIQRFGGKLDDIEFKAGDEVAENGVESTVKQSAADDILSAITGRNSQPTVNASAKIADTSEPVGNAGKANPEVIADEVVQQSKVEKAVSQDYDLMTLKLSQFKKVTDAQIVYDTLRNVRVINIKGQEVGDIPVIAQELRNYVRKVDPKNPKGLITNPAFEKIIDELEPLVGSSDPQRVAKFLDDTRKTPEFRAVAKALRGFSAGGRIKASDPALGYRGSAVLAKGDPNDIAVVKTPATLEEGQAFLEARAQAASLELMDVPFAKEVKAFADQLFNEAIGQQSLKGGSKVTKRGAIQNALGPEAGAKFTGKWNTHASIAYIRSALQFAENPKFKSAAQKDAVFTGLIRDVESRLRVAGVDIHLSNMSPHILRYADHGRNTVMTVRLGLSDVLDALGKEARIKYLYTPGQRLSPTILSDVAEMLVRSATKLDANGKVDLEHVLVMGLLAARGKLGRSVYAREMKTNLDLATQRSHIYNILHRMGHDDLAAHLRAGKGFENGKKIEYEIVDIERYLDETLGDGEDIRGLSVFNEAAQAYDSTVLVPLLNDFLRGIRNNAAPVNQLIYRNMENTSAVGEDLLSQAKIVTDEKFNEIKSALVGGSPGDVITAITKQVDPPSNASDIKLATEALDEANVSKVATPKEVKRAKATKKIADKNRKKGTITKTERVTNNAKLYDNDKPNLDEESIFVNDKTIDVEMRQERAVTFTEELYDTLYREHSENLMKGLFGLSSRFNNAFGRDVSWETITQSAHAHPHIMTAFHKALNRFNQGGSEPLRASTKRIQEAFKEGNLSSLTPNDHEFYKVINTIFDPSTNNFFDRNSVGIDAFLKNVDENFPKDQAEMLRNSFEADGVDYAKVWQDWDITEPFDFFSKMMHVMAKTAEEVTMGAAFTVKFGSDVKLPGYVKVADTGSEFMKVVDLEKYYPRELANEMANIDKAFTESRYITNNFIKHAWDPIISTIKMTQTTLKPGHHVMSIIGDGWRNSMAGMGASTKEYGQMAKIMAEAVPFERALGPADELRHTMEIAQNVKVGPTQKGFQTLMIGGKPVKVGNQQLWDIMKQRGVVLPTHIGGAAEDFLTDFPALEKSTAFVYEGIAKVTKGIDKVVNHRNFLNAFAARRDSIMRGALFLNTLGKKRFKTLEEAVDYAASHVKKWAPVATDLATWESKVARRAIFYYTWIRGITPRVIETALTRPGLAMVPSKAMYNFAITNGIDPVSFGDPFPDDGTMFPSWYKERVLGPQWLANGDLMGVSPTSPILDVFNSLGSNVSVSDFNPFRAPGPEQNAAEKLGQTLIGMSTPWIKAPVELVTNRRMDSGAPIEDDVQYLQDLIGPARVASKITGKNINGMNRTEAMFEDGLTPEESQNNTASELINFFTGSGLTNYTSDSATKSAEFQERDKLNIQKAINERMGNGPQ